MVKKAPGVEEVPAAEEQEEIQEEIDLSEFLDESEEDEGEEEEREIEPEDNDEEFEDSHVSQAFAKRLAAREAQIRKEFEQQYQQPPVQPQNQQTQAPQQNQMPAELSQEQLEQLADKLGVTPEFMNLVYKQQLVINQQGEFLRKMQGFMSQVQDQSSLGLVKAQVEAQRAANPSLPLFDEARIKKVRDDYQKKHNINLPVEAAYDLIVAEDTRKGKITRDATQQTLKKVAKRNKATAKKSGTQQAKKPDIWDLSDAQFEAMKEKAKQGGYKRS